VGLCRWCWLPLWKIYVPEVKNLLVGKDRCVTDNGNCIGIGGRQGWEGNGKKKKEGETVNL
jgi:hypothetical protein